MKHKHRIQKLLLIAIGLFSVYIVMKLIFSLSAQTGNTSGSLSSGLYEFLSQFEFLNKILYYWDKLVLKILYFLNLEELYPFIFSTYSNWEIIIRKWAHFGIYMTMGMLSMGVFTYAFNIFKAFTITFYIGGLFAFTDEIHQLFVEGRSGQISDFGIDVLGLVTGMSVCVGIYAFYIIITTGYKSIRKASLWIKDTVTSNPVKDL